MTHDLCYEEVGDDQEAKRICDRNLVFDLDTLPDSPKDWQAPPPPGTELGTKAYRWGTRWAFDR